MESRRRDKLDASYITDLKIIQDSSEIGSNTVESDMDASKPMKYESITRPVPTVPSNGANTSKVNSTKNCNGIKEKMHTAPKSGQITQKNV